MTEFPYSGSCSPMNVASGMMSTRATETSHNCEDDIAFKNALGITKGCWLRVLEKMIVRKTTNFRARNRGKMCGPLLLWLSYMMHDGL